MLKFAAKRLMFCVLTIWAVATFAFILIHKLPGDPFTSTKVLQPQVVMNLKAKYGLDKPLPKQYAVYMWNLLRGDLGVSMVYANRSVNSIIARTFPVSADLGFKAFVISLTLGISMGTMAAVYHKKSFDYVSLIFATISVSIPGFIVGTIIQYFLCFKLNFAPRVITYIILAVPVLYIFQSFLYNYYFVYPKQNEYYYQVGMKQVAEYIKENQDNYSRVFMTNNCNQPFVYMLFYLGYDPAKYQTVEKNIDYKDFGTVYSFDKYYFMADTQMPLNYSNAMFITRPDATMQRRKLLKTVTDSIGRPVFCIWG